MIIAGTASARRFGTTFSVRRESNAPFTKFAPLGDGAVGLTKVLSATGKPVRWLPRHGTSGAQRQSELRKESSEGQRISILPESAARRARANRSIDSCRAFAPDDG